MTKTDLLLLAAAAGTGVLAWLYWKRSSPASTVAGMVTSPTPATVVHTNGLVAPIFSIASGSGARGGGNPIIGSSYVPS
jgi:hypothetical protein